MNESNEEVEALVTTESGLEAGEDSKGTVHGAGSGVVKRKSTAISGLIDSDVEASELDMQCSAKHRAYIQTDHETMVKAVTFVRMFGKAVESGDKSELKKLERPQDSMHTFLVISNAPSSDGVNCPIYQPLLMVQCHINLT